MNLSEVMTSRRESCETVKEKVEGGAELYDILEEGNFIQRRSVEESGHEMGSLNYKGKWS